MAAVRSEPLKRLDVVGAGRSDGAELNTQLAMDLQGERQGRLAPAVHDLAGVALANADRAKTLGQGRVVRTIHARVFADCKVSDKPLVCSVANDAAFEVLQNAKMELPDLPNENFVQAWRERKGLTQAQLGEAIGTTGSVVSLMEAGKRQLSPKWLRRIAAAFQIPTGYLLEHHPDSVPADVLELWAAIPESERPAAMRMLRSLGQKTGTEG